MQIGLSNLK